jgi:hypothetical protein
MVRLIPCTPHKLQYEKVCRRLVKTQCKRWGWKIDEQQSEKDGKVSGWYPGSLIEARSTKTNVCAKETRLRFGYRAEIGKQRKKRE